MSHGGPRVLLIGGTYRALCVLEHLLERGERVVAFVGQEGGRERDFCPEILEICDRTSIPARSGRKLGEEMVRWLEDRIRPDLAIAVGVTAEIPLAIGGNCRLGLLEVIDEDVESSEAAAPRVVLRQRGKNVAERSVASQAGDEPEDWMLAAIDATLGALDQYLDRVDASFGEPALTVPFLRRGHGAEIEDLVEQPMPGPETLALEEAAARYLGADRVFALRSAEEAFARVMSLIDLQEGDEVLCPAPASNAALRALQKRGVDAGFVDVDPERMTIDPVRVREAIGERTRAILVSHAFGQPAELEALYALAEERGLELIEDGASALGAKVGDSRLGRAPCLAAFSLSVSPVPGGEVELVSVPGPLVDRFEAALEGARAGNGVARLARAELEGWDDRISERRKNASVYSSELVRYDAFQIPATPEEALPVYGQYVLRLTRFARTSADDLHKLLCENGVESYRIALQLSEREVVRLPATESILMHGLMLPVDAGLSDSQLEHVLEAIYDYALG